MVEAMQSEFLSHVLSINGGAFFANHVIHDELMKAVEPYAVRNSKPKLSDNEDLVGVSGSSSFSSRADTDEASRKQFC